MSQIVSDDGLLVPQGDRPLLVEIGGHYVWSTTPRRDGTGRGSQVLVPWPEVLRPHLVGTGRVRVATVEGDVVVHDGEVSLGGGEGELAILDRSGNRLSVDKVGHLTRSFADTGEGIRDEILSGTRRAIDDLRAYAGVEAYLNYGALLGAIREGRMLAHDSDTDLCYLTKHESPADIILESYRITRTMRAQGWNALRMSGGDVKLLLPLSDGRVCHIDVFVAFHVDGTFYQLGNRSGHLPREAIVPFSTIELHGYEFPAPRDTDAMLSFLYGPNWRTPDPSFRYADPVDGVRRLDGWLRGFRTQMGDWTEFYATLPPVPRTGSLFSGWVNPQVGDLQVVDIGTGIGRDALSFARGGRRVLALDFSRGALARARRRAEKRGIDLEFDQLILGELRSTLALGTRLAREPSHLYLRHTLGALDAPARDQLWLLARMALRPGGGRLFCEFQATGRGLEATAEPGGLVRRSDVDEVRRAIEAAGGVVEHLEVGEGLDIFDRPDPAVARLRAAWPAPSTTRAPRASAPTEQEQR